VTPLERSGKGWIGIGILDAFKTIKPGAVEAVRLSVTKNIEWAGLIAPHALGPADARDVAASVDGASGDRSAVR
jgi:hypothetical protein